MSKPEVRTDPVPLEELLGEEYRVLRPNENFDSKDLGEMYRRAHQQEQRFSALCISGGGIRSATFSMGVIQSLAEKGILEKFDYLSTVSGGGYIGGWMTAWINRAKGIDNVIPHLRRDAPPPAAGEADPIQHLRDYNNYLTPRLGAMSADTWTLAATILRNVFLNWLVLVPLLMCALMAPRLVLALVRYAEFYKDHYGAVEEVSNAWAVTVALPAATGLLFACSMFNILRYLPGVGDQNHTASDFTRFILAPLVISTLAFCAYDSLYFCGSKDVATGLVQVSLWALTPCVGAWLLYLATCGRPLSERWRLLTGPLSLATVMLGVGTGTVAWALTNHLFESTSWELYTTIGPPMLMFGFGVSAALFVGLSSRALQDEAREWMARGAAKVLRFCTAWIVGCLIVLLLPAWLLGRGFPPWVHSLIAGIGVVAGWASSYAGYRGPEMPDGSGPLRPISLTSLALRIAPPLFIVLLAVGLAVLTNLLMESTDTFGRTWWKHQEALYNTPWWEVLLWAAAFFSLSWVMARYVNINQFSLEGMYRERLIRAYLGASNSKRNVNHFTGFAQSDNMQMHSLDPQLRPFHVLNLTLNLVGGDRLAWQQRKAESFTVSPLHCGNAHLGYRDSANYAGARGISLGTAMAVSGAAASPNMGYHSSPVIGLLMTLFNLRLGGWFGNPGEAGKKTWRQGGPSSAVGCMVREALGLTTDKGAYVYLSDGGHFENLGIYEMVRRRCRTIVVIDAGCDPSFTYEDLGNALRKIRIDLKIPITFAGGSTAPMRALKKRCAVATIHYSAVDGKGTDGQLLYIKPMFLGDESPDVTSYHSAHPTFPHQSTAEQWFDESQTESYRMLGLQTADQIFSHWDMASLETMCLQIERDYLRVAPDAAAIQPASTQ